NKGVIILSLFMPFQQLFKSRARENWVTLGKSLLSACNHSSLQNGSIINRNMLTLANLLGRALVSSNLLALLSMAYILGDVKEEVACRVNTKQLCCLWNGDSFIRGSTGNDAHN